MAKFFGSVGYAFTVEGAPGVSIEKITERSYYGDVIRNTRRLSDGTDVNPDVTVGNSISILADPYANEHFFAIRYVEWAGTLWTVSQTVVERPRLLLRLGKVYNGERAEVEVTDPPAEPPADG